MVSQAAQGHHRGKRGRLRPVDNLPRVQQRGTGIGLHDHTFEEAYFILSGEVEGTLDGRTYRATAGDVLWTSVGCVHAFGNVGREPVRWLETFAPQPPKENVFRFMAEWEAKAKEI